MPVTGGHPTDPATGGATAPARQPGTPATAPVRHDADRRRTAAPGTIPTQRTRGTEAPAAQPTALEGPPPAARAPFALDAPARPARRRRTGRGRAVAAAVLCVALVGAVAAGIVVQLRADARAAAWARAQERVAAAYAAQRVDEAFVADARAARAAGRYDALVAGAVRDAGTVVTAARAAADASPHAGDAPLAALRAAADAAQRAADGAGSGVSPATVAAAVASVAAPQRAAVDAEAAWQAAEAARIAAERAAAERAAAEAAQRAATPRASAGARSARAAAPATSGGGAAAPAPAAAWAPGVASYGIGGLGAALNAARAENGLPALSVSGSSSLADHAAAMAAAGSIWHSGNDHIVGWVQPVSDSQMIAAYMNSPGHRAWILKADKSSVSIGAVTINGRLYTAMRFS